MLAGKFENETEPWLGRYFEQKICWEFCKISVVAGKSKRFLLAYSSHFHSNFQRGMEVNTTRDVTRLFWPRQNGRPFWAQRADFKGPKSSFKGALA